MRHLVDTRARAIVGAGLLAALVPLGLIWMPAFRYYHVPTESIPTRSATDILRSMDPRVCRELTQFDILPLGLPARAESRAPVNSLTSRVLDSLRRGVLPLPFGARLPFARTFSAADFGQSDSYLKLNVAGLAVPKALVWAWRQTGDAKWLELAHGYVDSWWAVERRTWVPRDFQWNDHAVAARVMTLTQYLCAMRSQPSFSDSAAAEVLEMLATSGERLVKPRYFTFRTNHGVMQNVALLDIAAAVPRLPQSARFADTARARLDAQLPYFVGPEGVVFEHSAHYHLWGTALLHMVIRHYEALGIPVPAELSRRYADALEFSRQLLRLDGSVPSWGNSFRGARGSEVPAELSTIVDTAADMEGRMRSRAPATWAPTSGVAVWWAGRPSAGSRPASAAQTVVAWADFATQAHKHADDMSVLVWTGRSDILIGSGYWPNDSPDYEDAYGWAGSNAPHFVDESGDVSPVPSPSSPRPRGTTSVRATATSTALEFIDMERASASGGHLRRQVAFARPDLWVIIDVASDGPAAFETSWLLDPRLSLKPTVPGTSFTVDAPAGSVARIDLGGCSRGSLFVERGSRSPFSGWTAADGAVVPTTALRRRCHTGTWSAMSLQATPAGAQSDAQEALVVDYASPERWQVRRVSSGDTLLRRDSATLHVRGSTCTSDCTVRVRADSASNQARARIDSLYFDMQRHYTPFSELLSLRIRMTKVIVVLWIAQLLVTLAAGPMLRRWVAYPAVVVSLLAIVGWLIVALCLQTAYLR